MIIIILIAIILIAALLLQALSACGVTPSSRTDATLWWSSSSEPSCTPRMENFSTSCVPESQVNIKYRSGMLHSAGTTAAADQKWMRAAVKRVPEEVTEKDEQEENDA